MPAAPSSPVAVAVVAVPAVVVTKPLVIALEDRAKRINEAHDALGGCLNQAGNWAVILGVELHDANAALGERRGRPGKNRQLADIPATDEKPVTFPDWLKANCPAVPLRSAERYMALAKAAKSHLLKNGEEAIRALLDKPAGDLSEADRKQLLKTIRKITDGKTYEQLALDFGIKGGKGKKTGKGTGDNGQDSKNASNEPPIGWSAEEWDARNAADPEEQEAIDICRPVESGILQILETASFAHLPKHFLGTLEAAVELLATKLAEIRATAKETKGSRK
jgi:hypothetical protein